MSEITPIDKQRDYISEIINQRIHTLVLTLQGETSNSSSTELKKIINQYGSTAVIMVVMEVISTILPVSEGSLGSISGTLDFTSRLFQHILYMVDAEYIFENAFENYQSKGSVLSYSSFLKALNLDDTASCCLSIILTNISHHPFKNEIKDFLKSALPNLTYKNSKELLNIYQSDIIDYINLNKALWSNDVHRQLINKAFQERSQNVSSIYQMSVLYNPITSDTQRNLYPSSVYIPTSHISLSLITEMGYIVSANLDIMTALFQQVMKDDSHFKTHEIVVMIIQMINSTPIEKMEEHLTLIKDMLYQLKLTLPDTTMTSWNVDIVVKALRTVIPTLNFEDIFKNLDCPEFELKTPNAFLVLAEFWKVCEMEGSIFTLLSHPWKNLGQLSLLQHVITCKEAASMPFKKNINPSFLVPPEYKIWTSDDVIEGIFSLLESDCFHKAKQLLSMLSTKQPSLLLLILLSSTNLSYMKRFVLEQLFIQVLSNPITPEVRNALNACLNANKNLIMQILELYLRSREIISTTMLVNINKLDLQEQLLQSSDHTVFNHIFINNWSSEGNEKQGLKTILIERIKKYDKITLLSMISYINEHVTSFIKQSRSLFSLLGLISQCNQLCKAQNPCIQMDTIINDIFKKCPELKQAWDHAVDNDVQSITQIVLQSSFNEDQFCDRLRVLHKSSFIYDKAILTSFLNIIIDKIAEALQKTVDLTSVSNLITVVRTITEHRLLEEQESHFLSSLIEIIINAAAATPTSLLINPLIGCIRRTLHDYPELEDKLLKDNNVTIILRKQTPSTPQPEFILPSNVPMLRRSDSSFISPTITHSTKRIFNEDAFSHELYNYQPFTEEEIQKLKRLMNQMGENNLNSIIAQLHQMITPLTYAPFSFFLIPYIINQDLYAKMFYTIIMSFQDELLNTLVLDASIRCAIQLLKQHSNGTHDQLKRLGRFIGMITIARDKALPLRKLNIQLLLQKCHENNIVLNVLIFVSQFILQGLNSTVFKSIKQPWLHSILVELNAIQLNENIPSTEKSQYVNIVMDKFKITEEETKEIQAKAHQYLQSMYLSPIAKAQSAPQLQPLSQPLNTPSATNTLSKNFGLFWTRKFGNLLADQTSIQVYNAAVKILEFFAAQLPTLAGHFAFKETSYNEDLDIRIQKYAETVVRDYTDKVYSAFSTYLMPLGVTPELISEYTHQFLEFFKGALQDRCHECYSPQSNMLNMLSNENTKYIQKRCINDLTRQFIENCFNAICDDELILQENQFRRQLNALYYNYRTGGIQDVLYQKAQEFLITVLRDHNNKTAVYKSYCMAALFKVLSEDLRIPPCRLLEITLKELIKNQIKHINLFLIIHCLKKNIITSNDLDIMLSNCLMSTTAGPEKANLISICCDIINQLMMARHILFSISLKQTLTTLSECISTSSYLKETLSQLQQHYILHVHYVSFQSRCTEILRAWIGLFNSDCQSSDKAKFTFILFLKQRGLLVSEIQTIIALHLLFNAAIKLEHENIASEVLVNELPISPLRAYVLFIITLLQYTDIQSKPSVLSCALTAITSSITEQQKSESNGGMLEAMRVILDLIQLIFEPFLPRLLSSLNETISTSDRTLCTDYARILISNLNQLNPTNCPLFTFNWLTIISNSLLIQVCAVVEDTIIFSSFTELLESALRFISPFYEIMKPVPSIEALLRSITTVMMALYKYWPEILYKNYGNLCLLVPIQCIQLHNIITAAQPKAIEQIASFNPTSPELAKALKTPDKYPWDVSELLKPLQLDNLFKSYNSKTYKNFNTELYNIAKKGPFRPQYLALLYGVAANTYIKEPNSEVNFPVEFYELLLRKDTAASAHDTIMAILDHIRYASYDTYAFCKLINTLIQRDAKHIIKSVLIERLSIPGPKSWGLQFLFRELIKSKYIPINELANQNKQIQDLIKQYEESIAN